MEKHCVTLVKIIVVILWAVGMGGTLVYAADNETYLDGTGKWIDVISLNTYYKKGAEDRKAFNWIIVELFPRKMQHI